MYLIAESHDTHDIHCSVPSGRLRGHVWHARSYTTGESQPGHTTRSSMSLTLASRHRGLHRGDRLRVLLPPRPPRLVVELPLDPLAGVRRRVVRRPVLVAATAHPHVVIP